MVIGGLAVAAWGEPRSNNMEEEIKKLVGMMDLNPGAKEQSLLALSEETGYKFLHQYLEFMRFSDGAEGPIGPNNYLVIWPINEIKELNKGYAVDEFAPGLVLFGGDGGDTAYAFDTRSEEMPIVEVSLEDLDIRNVKPCGATFNDFLEYISQ